MKANKELLPFKLEFHTPVSLFDDGQLPDVVTEIEATARAQVFDIDTNQGRKDCASLAYKVARSKTYLDRMGKDHTTDLKARVRNVDNQRKVMRERLDALRDEIRKPLNDIEEAERAHEDAIVKRIEGMNLPIPSSAAEIKGRIDTLERIEIDASFSKWIRQAENAKATALSAARRALAEAEKAEAEEEQRRIAAARAQKEREAKIAQEAAERATREAELRLEQEKAEAEKRRQAAERAEQEAKERIADQERITREREKLAAEQAEAAERERLEREERRRQAAEDARQADKAHREEVEDAIAIALTDIVSKHTDDYNLALSIVDEFFQAVKSGQLPHVTINY